MKLTRFTAVFGVCLLLIVRIAAADTLHVNTTSSSPLATPAQDGFQDRVAIEAFRRLGHDISIEFLPGERSLVNLDRGIDDATLVRIRGIEKAYSSVRRVPEKVMDWTFVAFTRDNSMDVKTWADLKPYHVAFLKGWKIYEKNVQDVRYLTKVNTPEQMFRLLADGKVDVVLFEKWSGLELRRKLDMKDVRMLTAPLAVKEMFLYVHEKHAALVDPLAKALHTMKADGTYTRIFRETLAPLVQP